MILEIYNTVAAIYMVIAQAIDLHTTSEDIKNKVGQEDNENLSVLNSDAPHARKFWILTAAKLVGAGCSILIALIAWLHPELEVAAALLNTTLAVYYTRILINNIKIYRGINNGN